MSADLRFACSPKRWKQFVDRVTEATELPGLIKKNSVTAIVIETTKGNCRFDLDTSGQEPGVPR